jgi:hypothetical protein
VDVYRTWCSSHGTLYTEIKFSTLHVRNVLLSHHEFLLFVSSDSVEEDSRHRFVSLVTRYLILATGQGGCVCLPLLNNDQFLGCCYSLRCWSRWCKLRIADTRFSYVILTEATRAYRDQHVTVVAVETDLFDTE